MGAYNCDVGLIQAVQDMRKSGASHLSKIEERMHFRRMELGTCGPPFSKPTFVVVTRITPFTLLHNEVDLRP